MSDRMIAILASVMAAISFVHDSTRVDLRIGGARCEGGRAIRLVRFDAATVALSSEGVRLEVGAGDEIVAIVVRLALDRT